MTEHTEHHHKKRKISPWKISTMVFGVLFVVFLVLFLKGGSMSVGAISKDAAAEKAIGFVNTNLLQAGTTAELGEVTEEAGLYKAELTIAGQSYDSYITKDGKLFFPQAIPLEEVENTEPDQPNVPEVTKSDKPVFDLFVMAQCPYGTIAEEASFPVVELFGDKIEFNLHYIATDKGDGTFTSLHGQPEVDGDMRQVVIMQEYPDKYMDYILCVNEKYQDLEGNWEACAEDLGIDVDKIKTTMENDGADLLSANVVLADERGVGGSPTFYINGAKVSVTRTQEGVKQALCAAFNDAPEDICGQALENVQTTAAGSC